MDIVKRPLVALTAALALCIAGAASAQAASTTTSSNWAGYAVRRTGVAFRHVSGTWTVPAVDCSTGARGYSANWLGLGGYSSSSQALEQLGTESDCSSGKATYSAWFEVVPDAAVTAKLTIKPGDVIFASTAVSGTVVTLKLIDRTTGGTATRTVHATTVDTSSAEWIVEAPALCAGSTSSSCSQTALANFGTTGFSATKATTRGGHTGTVLDSAWTPVAITLSPTAGGGPGFLRGGGPGGPGRFNHVGTSTAGTATPGALSATGDAFTVTYAVPAATPAPTTTTPPATTTPATGT
jgi:hypothetical protein